MTPDINCEVDVKHPKQNKKDFMTLRMKISEYNARQVTVRKSKILSFKDMLLNLMFQGNSTES